jgi:hypothetical protein
LRDFDLVGKLNDDFRPALIGGYKAGDFNILSDVLLRVGKFGNAGSENYCAERTSIVIGAEIYKYSPFLGSINMVNFASYADSFADVIGSL